MNRKQVKELREQIAQFRPKLTQPHVMECTTVVRHAAIHAAECINQLDFYLGHLEEVLDVMEVLDDSP